MFNIVKWAYRRGVMYERSRIKRLIAEFSRQTQEMEQAERFRMPGENDADADERRMKRLAARQEAQRVLYDLITTRDSEWVPKSPAPIDEGGDD